MSPTSRSTTRNRARAAGACLVGVALGLAGAGLTAPSAGASPTGGGRARHYLVTFEPGADRRATVRALERRTGVDVTHLYAPEINEAAVSTTLYPGTLADVPGVESVQADHPIGLPAGERMSAPLVPPGTRPAAATTPSATEPTTTTPAESTTTTEPGATTTTTEPATTTTEPGTTTTTTTSTTSTTTTTTVPAEDPVLWGLDRSDQRALPLDGGYRPPGSGQGVRAYIMDTGINTSHAEFEGRLAEGADFMGDGQGTEDCNGHGTHVAGTVGGTTTGMAGHVTLIPVRVLDCEGEGDTIAATAGIDWILRHHPVGAPGVVNMSFGADNNEGMAPGISALVRSGLSVVVAAGNDAEPTSCNQPGATIPGVLLVGASDMFDDTAEFTNYGPCLDLFAPGVGIRSAWIGSPTATNTIQGTSMSAPHVTGAVAVLLAMDPWRSATDVESTVIADSTAGVVVAVPEGTPNKLLFVDPARTATPAPAGSAPPERVTAPPVDGSADVLAVSAEQTSAPASLAFTGRDPRKLLLLSSLFLLGGMLAIGGAAFTDEERRRDRRRTT